LGVSLSQFIIESQYYKSNSHDSSDSPNFPIYSIGKLGESEIWINPYLKYNDNTLVIFDEVNLNIDYYKPEIVNEATFSPRIKIEYRLCIDSVKSTLLYLIEDVESVEYGLYLTYIRDKKIDEIVK
jgi:hypothetical protein